MGMLRHKGYFATEFVLFAFFRLALCHRMETVIHDLKIILGTTDITYICSDSYTRLYLVCANYDTT